MRFIRFSQPGILVKSLSDYLITKQELWSRTLSIVLPIFEINIISVDFFPEYLNLNLLLYPLENGWDTPFRPCPSFILPLVGMFSVNANSFLHQQKQNWIRKAIWYVVNQTKAQWISKPRVNLRCRMMCRKEKWAQIRRFGVQFRRYPWLTAWPWESHLASPGF